MEPSPRRATQAANLPARLQETHISVVFLLGERALKLKKPVALGFLDWRTRAARRAACQREVELNRRLAPDVYLGVADVLGPDGVPCEHLVVMRRMPEERSLSRLVKAGALSPGGLEQVASVLVQFHSGAPRSPALSELALGAGLRRRWDDNIAELQAGPCLERCGAAELGEIESLAQGYLAGRAPLLAERAAAGMAVDGHGDLLAADVYLLEDGPRLLDCLEFDDGLRAVDVLDDAAFLAMDLERLGTPELGAHFLGAYCSLSGGRHPASLAHHYIAYRAGVRAKVAAIRAGQGDPAAAEEAEGLIHLCHRHLRAGRVRLVLVGGLPATGKSTLARLLAEQTGWKVLRSDVVRKEIAGLDPLAQMAGPYGKGIYAPRMTRATYTELFARARRLLERGESVIIDASFVEAGFRRQAALTAEGTSSELAALCCEVAPEVAAARLAGGRPGDASDATPAVAAAMAARAEPWPEAAAIDTAAGPDEAVRAAATALGLEPAEELWWRACAGESRRGEAWAEMTFSPGPKGRRLLASKEDEASQVPTAMSTARRPR